MTNSADPKPKAPRFRLPRLGVLVLAPLLAFLTLGAWAFASPVASSPDDDFHLVSIWCADGGSEYCEPGEVPSNRLVNSDLLELHCFAYDENTSASCQNAILAGDDSDQTLTRRGNFAGNYPPLYYSTMHLFAGQDILASAMVMRVVNILLFVGLSTALFLLLPIRRRPILVWGWLVTLIPLGVFLVASNNPSGWAVTAVGSAWLALLGFFETEGQRRIALGGLFLLSVLMAAGARSDAAFFVAGGTVTVLILKAVWERRFFILSLVPLVGIAIAAVFILAAGQTASGVEGFGVVSSGEASADAAAELGSGGLLAYNILNLPYLWTGVFGGWGLGWLDTAMPTMVLWAAASAFIVFGFIGLAVMSKRKAIAAGGTALVLVVLPLYVLWKSSAPVGHQFQARYILPLIVILAFVLLYEPVGRQFRLSRVQRLAIIVALSIANFVALQVNIRRYVTGVDSPGASLDSGAEWWWSGVPFSPNVVWIVGSLAFAGLVVVVARELSKPLATSQLHETS